jgi:catechol 2,3-dioxygenase-like lactoylglutathione lyase family enzyme
VRRAAPLPEIGARVLGRFHEVSITTADIRESVEFYESLGFSQAPTTDAQLYPYGVLTDGRLFLGLHERRGPSVTLTFVLPDLADHLSAFEKRGIDLSVCKTGSEVFNEIGFRDPFGQDVTVLEARTYSPVARKPADTSLCGYFDEISMPVQDFEAAKAYWEPLGFVATQETDMPYVHLPLTSDHLDIAFHRPRTFDGPMIVFRDPNMATRVARLRELGVKPSPELPRGLDSKANALVESPEGVALLLLEAES